jgi:hypothetical protein
VDGVEGHRGEMKGAAFIATCPFDWRHTLGGFGGWRHSAEVMCSEDAISKSCKLAVFPLRPSSVDEVSTYVPIEADGIILHATSSAVAHTPPFTKEEDSLQSSAVC